MCFNKINISEKYFYVNSFFVNINIMKNFFIKSMGCKSNQFEGEVIVQNLSQAGFSRVLDIKNADFFILNSCSVTHKSDNEVFYILRNAKRLNPQIKTILTGCVAQIQKEKLLEYDFIDFVFGNDEKLNLTDLLNQDTKINVSDIMSLSEFHETFLASTSKTRASLKIQDGCDNRCSYCIIPFARGKSRSAQENFILKQLEFYQNQGFKEVILTGIHIGQWGKEFNKSLLNLLKTINQNTSIRYRLGSLNPLEINDEMLEFLSQSDKFCPHFHLSLQSACNSTLNRMNRFYQVEDYLVLIDKIDKMFDLPFIGSDIIAGFVGESEEDFQITVENLKKSKLTAIHTFPYSIRQGTFAAGLEEHLNDEVKQKRAEIIKLISKEKMDTFLNKNIGKVHSVLIEKKVDKKTGFLKGISKNYIEIVIKNANDEILKNTVQKVKFQNIVEGRFYGELV